MKKILSILMAFAMILSFVVPVRAEADKAMEKIDFLKQSGMVTGDSSGDLRLEDSITRAEMATMLIRMMSLEDLDKKSFQGVFQDVPETFWAWKYIETAFEKNLVKGLNKDFFAPESKVKYAEAMTMLVRMNEEWKEENIEWPKSYVEAAEKFGLTEDMKVSDVMMEATRKDVFVMIYNQMNRAKMIPLNPMISENNYFEDFKKFVTSIDASVFEREGIAANGDAEKQKRIDSFLSEYEKAKKMVTLEQLTEEQLTEMMKMYKVEKNKVKGTLKDLGKKVMVEMIVEGEPTVKTATDKAYPILKDNIIIVKTPYKGLTADGKEAKLYLNYVIESDYEPKADTISGATPKYKKTELPKDHYKIEEIEGGYKITIMKLPEGTVILKPVIKVMFAEKAYVENGAMVFVVK